MATATYLEARTMNCSEASDSILMRSSLYRDFLAEREEILKHKWIESEKAGHYIGFERALIDWITKYRAAWCRERRELRASRLVYGGGR